MGTDPMDIDKIAFQLKNPLGVVTVKFTENTVEGLSTHTINSIRANKAAKTLSMDIFVPKATAKGLYHMQGVRGCQDGCRRWQAADRPAARCDDQRGGAQCP